MAQQSSTEAAADQPTLTFETEGLTAPDAFFLYAFRGREGLSQLYEYEVEVASHVGLLTAEEIDAILTMPAAVHDELSGHAVRGAVRSVELLPHEASMLDGETAGALPRYLLRVVPRVWGLTQTVRSRAFYHKSTTDLLEQLLKDAGLEGADYELKLTRSYSPRELTIQYQESDWDFLVRLLEREGILYLFDHSGDGEKLVFSDGDGAFEALPDPFLYRPVTGLVPEQAVSEMSLRQQVVPRAAWVRDYSHLTPATLLQSNKAPIDEDGWPASRVGSGAQVFFGEHARDVADANRLAKLRAEEQLAHKLVASGRTGSFGLAPGRKLTLENHLDARMNQEWLITAVDHWAYQQGLDAAPAGGGETAGYGNQFEAIPATAVYRPPRLAPWPRIPGLVTAHVKGKGENPDAPIDDRGRYPLVFHFDTTATLGVADGETVWVRMAQSSSGPGYGTHLPLHEGAEVLVAFVNGDPDRPVIVGTVPNELMTSPITSFSPTRSTVQSRAAVKIEMDDDA